MGYWDSRIKDHAIWELLRTLGQRIDAARSQSGNDDEAIEAIERARAMLSYFGKRLAAIDPFLAYPGPLDEMVPPLQEAAAHLATFETTGDKNLLLAANKHFDVAAYGLLRLPGPPFAEDLTTISESAASYRESLGRQSASFSQLTATNSELAGKLSQQLEKLAQDAEKERARLDAVVSVLIFTES